MPNYRLLDIKYLLLHKIWLKLLSKIKKNGVGVFYVKWSNNFGDMLTPVILKYYGFTPFYEYPAKSSVISIGTILSIVGNDWNGYVVGSGWNRFEECRFPKAVFLGVRGFLTKKYLGLENVVIGDPALIMPIIYPVNAKKKFKVGLIPHESEVSDIRVCSLISGDLNCKLILPNRTNPIEVIKDICDCEYILSSSLHGLILSDAYGIPNVRIKFNELDEFDDFKFKDYYSSLGENLHTLTISGTEKLDDLIKQTRLANSDIIKSIQKNIDQMFISLKSILK